MRDMCTEFPGSSYQEGSAVTSPPQSDGTRRGVRISGYRGSPSNFIDNIICTPRMDCQSWGNAK